MRKWLAADLCVVVIGLFVWLGFIIAFIGAGAFGSSEEVIVSLKTETTQKILEHNGGYKIEVVDVDDETFKPIRKDTKKDFIIIEDLDDFLHFGLISERKIYKAVITTEKGKDGYTRMPLDKYWFRTENHLYIYEDAYTAPPPAILEKSERVSFKSISPDGIVFEHFMYHPLTMPIFHILSSIWGGAAILFFVGSIIASTRHRHTSKKTTT